MILCHMHPWYRVRRLWYRLRDRMHGLLSHRAKDGTDRPRKFEKAELIEKYGFNRHL